MDPVHVRLKYREDGVHVKIDVFAGPDAEHLAHCGRLGVRMPEFQGLVSALEDASMMARARVRQDLADQVDAGVQDPVKKPPLFGASLRHPDETIGEL